MDFYELLTETEAGMAHNPYAVKINGRWVPGGISIDFLNDHFGHLETAEEMIDATNSEGLKLYFDRLKKRGVLK